MQHFIRFFVDRQLTVNVIAIGIVVLGWFFIKDTPREYIPSVSSPLFFVTAVLPGASARDMETKITIPIEEALEEIDGIEEFHSKISDSTSVTTVEFFLDLDQEQVRDAERDLQQAIDGITDFPPEMEDEPTLEQFNPGKWPVIEITLTGPIDDVVTTAKLLERKLERSPGVSRATIVGLQDPETRILIDPAKAIAHNITVDDVITAIRERNVSSTGAVFEASDDRKQVVVWSRFHHPEDVADTIVRSSPTAGSVRVRDIARVESGREDTGLLTHTDGQRGLSLVVRKRAKSDAIDVAQRVRDTVASTPLPEGVTVKFVNDRSFYTSNRLSVMTTNGIMGGFLVALILFAFMRAGAAAWVLVGIPIVFMGALGVIGSSGLTLNLMTLTGLVIVLGMVVDDAVVVSENILAARGRGLSPRDAAIVGASEMVRPVTAAALTTMLAFLPMTALGGLPGKIMWQIPATVVMVLMFSLIESFCVLPAHMSHLKATTNVDDRRGFVKWMDTRYASALDWTLRHRWVVLGITFAIFAGIMIFVRPLLHFVLFPQDDARSLYVKVSLPIGTPLERTEAHVSQLASKIIDITGHELTAITARIGHQDVGGNEKPRGEAENEALLTAYFRDLDRRHTNAEWIQILTRDLTPTEGMRLVFQSEYIGPPTDQPVTLHVIANDDELRRGVAWEILEYLRNTPGLTEIDMDERPGTRQIDLNLNYDKLARLGITPAQVTRTVQASFFGIEATEHRDMVDTTELRVMFDPAARGDLQALLDTPIRAPDGRLVRLRDVVSPVEVPNLDRIYHRESFRASTVRASFTPDSGYTALTFAGKLRGDLVQRLNRIDGVEVLVGGEAKETEETTGELANVGLLVVAGIGIVIWLLLGSFLEALFVITVIPFAFAGVMLAFYLHNLPLSMAPMMGVIGLAGVVVNAAIVMLDGIHRRLRHRHPDDDVDILMREAVVSRLRPIVVTTLTTLVGVLPTAYGIGGYDTIVSPMSVAIGWGLVFSTGVTLFYVPVVHTIARDLREWTPPWRRTPAPIPEPDTTLTRSAGGG